MKTAPKPRNTPDFCKPCAHLVDADGPVCSKFSEWEGFPWVRLTRAHPADHWRHCYQHGGRLFPAGPRIGQREEQR